MSLVLQVGDDLLLEALLVAERLKCLFENFQALVDAALRAKVLDLFYQIDRAIVVIFIVIGGSLRRRGRTLAARLALLNPPAAHILPLGFLEARLLDEDAL